jgi:hypothetical protein
MTRLARAVAALTIAIFGRLKLRWLSLARLWKKDAANE